MKTEFINEALPSKYSQPTKPLQAYEQTKTVNGVTYKLIGESIEELSLSSRLIAGVHALAKTLFSLGLGLISECTRDDWRSFWTGRSCMVLYTSSNLLANNILANQGDPSAMFKLARMYESCDGVKQDLNEALNLYHQAALKGHKEAQYVLGVYYAHGQMGIQKDSEKAIEYYKMAADQEYAPAAFVLGEIYREAEWDSEAIKYYLIAANQGDVEALYGAARAYAGPQAADDENWEKYLTLAASKGHTKACYDMGWAHENGYIANPSLQKAVEYYRQAADKGNVISMEQLAEIYAKGKSKNTRSGTLQPNHEEALKYLRLGAEKNSSWCSFHLGWCYKKGLLGLEKNEVESKKHIEKASWYPHKDILGNSIWNELHPTPKVPQGFFSRLFHRKAAE